MGKYFLLLSFTVFVCSCQEEGSQQQEHVCVKGYAPITFYDVYWDSTIVTQIDLGPHDTTTICICDTLVYDARNTVDSNKVIEWVTEGGLVRQDSLKIFYNSTFFGPPLNGNYVFVVYLTNQYLEKDSSSGLLRFVECL